MRNKLVGLLMAAVLLFAAGIPAKAAESLPAQKEEEAVQQAEGYGVGPAYKDIYTPEDIRELLEKEEDSSVPAFREGGIVAASHEQAAAQLRNMLKARTTACSLTLTYTNQFSRSLFTQILEDAMAEGSAVPADEGDYIRANFIGYGYSVSFGGGSVNCALQFTYAANGEQEAQVTRRVAEVIAGLGLSGKGDYDRIKLIHDYIVSNTSYVNDGTYLCHSAYSALLRGTAVCQGYAGLFQRLCKEVGIETRYITGYGGGEAHAWNIVKLDGQWYNVDVTWDDPIGGSLRYDYFLKSEMDFADHTRDGAYDTAAFHKAYPMAEISYGETGEEGLNRDNYDFSFMGINGEQLSSTGTGRPKLLIFFNTICGNSQRTLQDIAASSWAASGAVDILAVETERHSRAEVEAFRNSYCPQGNIRFGYDLSQTALSAMWQYARLVEAGSSLYYPLLIMIDGDNKVQFYSIGYVPASRIERLYLPLLSTRNTFSDVAYNPGNWKYDAVQYVYEHSIMNGISGTDRFEPDAQLTRAMFATVLYRMAGKPKTAFSAVFRDVAEGKYYTEAILWANSRKIATGMGDGSFGVDNNITREQIAKMLYEFGSKQGYNVSGKEGLDSFTDASSVNGWAVGYIQWAVSAGMISGKPNGDGSYRLDPKGQATRAECAKMLMMFMMQYGN